MAVKFVSGQVLFVGGVVAMADDCCCDTTCPCCYYGLEIQRGADTFNVRFVDEVACTLGPDSTAQWYHCGDEAYVMTSGTLGGCTCYLTYDLDYNMYSTDPCKQQFYTESSLDQICNYNPPGPGTGTETHIGTMAFREVITATFCYDPCGTVTVSINHKLYCRFGVWIHDEPPPTLGIVTDTWVNVSTDLVADSTWTWTGVTAPNCTANYDLGAPTSETLATSYSKTWGTTYANCGGSSSFSVTLPAACSATGLILLGGGSPCNCSEFGAPPSTLAESELMGLVSGVPSYSVSGQDQNIATVLDNWMF